MSLSWFVAGDGDGVRGGGVDVAARTRGAWCCWNEVGARDTNGVARDGDGDEDGVSVVELMGAGAVLEESGVVGLGVGEERVRVGFAQGTFSKPGVIRSVFAHV